MQSRPLTWSLMRAAVAAGAVALSACIVVPPPDAPSEPAPIDDGPALEPHPPVVCQGSENIFLYGVYIETPDNAIEVLGNCDVTIRDSHLRAGGMAIYIAGNGDVRIESSLIEGVRAAVSIHGNGDVFATQSRIVGPTEVLGNGDIEDGGGNEWE